MGACVVSNCLSLLVDTETGRTPAAWSHSLGCFLTLGPPEHPCRWQHRGSAEPGWDGEVACSLVLDTAAWQPFSVSALPATSQFLFPNKNEAKPPKVTQTRHPERGCPRLTRRSRPRPRARQGKAVSFRRGRGTSAAEGASVRSYGPCSAGAPPRGSCIPRATAVPEPAPRWAWRAARLHRCCHAGAA